MSAFFENLVSFIKENGYNIFSVAVIEDGGEVEARMLQSVNPCQDSYSVAKAFTMTAIGMMYDVGILTPESRVIDLIGDEKPQNLNEKWGKVTIHHLLTHSAGLEHGCLDIDCIDANTFGFDYLDYLMHLDFTYEPGQGYDYSDGAYYLLARVVEHLVGEKLSTYLWGKLFYPLGFKEVAWSECPQGHCMGATGLYIRSEDMVKLGEVYRNKGVYKGQRIVSEEWVNLALKEGYELCPLGIGNTYGKGGMHGQKLFVDPDSSRSVAYHGFDNIDHNAIIEFTVNYKK